MCVSAPKIKPPAPAAAPASEGADALVLGTSGNTNEEELRQRGIQGRTRLFIGRGGARTRGPGSASSGGGSGSGGSSGGSSLAIGGGYSSGGGGGDVGGGGGGLTIGSGRGGYGLGGAIS